ncbi:MAG: exodeoxyribonuclease VII small subunit [Atopobiaceae bacterium]|nr:exodeoxyribonuclease VII small subunit [Atopobiaceae bacterium]
MAKKVDVSEYRTFAQISDRLDTIVDAVRANDISLERSLDLFDEAIALGSKAVDMVDATDFSPEEEARLAEAAAEGDAPEEPAAPASSGEDAE